MDPVRSRRAAPAPLAGRRRRRRAAPASRCTSPTSTTDRRRRPPRAPTTTITVPPTTTTTVALPPPVPIALAGLRRRARLRARSPCRSATRTRPGPPSSWRSCATRPTVPTSGSAPCSMNPGGPGASGVRRVTRGFQVERRGGRPVRHRGLRSPRRRRAAPRSRCGATVPAFRAVDLDPDSPAEDARRWRPRPGRWPTSAPPPKATASGTSARMEVAHDIEVIRRAIGEERISFVGLSYGTLIGQLWADRLPGLGAGAGARRRGRPGSPAAPRGRSARRTASTPSFDAIDDACAADAALPADRVRRGAGVLRRAGPSPRGRRGGRRRRRAHPARLRRLLRHLRLGDLAPAVAARSPAASTATWRGVADLAGSYTRLVPYAPFAIVTCLDGAHPDGYADWQEAGAIASRAARPASGAILANELLPCAFWPAGHLRAARRRRRRRRRRSW